MRTLIIIGKQPAERFVEHGDKPHGDVVDGQLLVASAEAAVLLVPADHLLHDAPPLVRRLVEVLFAGLVLSRRDHGLDPATPAPASDARVAVALVPGQPQRPPSLATTLMEQPPGHGRLE